MLDDSMVNFNHAGNTDNWLRPSSVTRDSYAKRRNNRWGRARWRQQPGWSTQNAVAAGGFSGVGVQMQAFRSELERWHRPASVASPFFPLAWAASREPEIPIIDPLIEINVAIVW